MYNKVVWSEGMFLFPQHFQQQDRYFEFLIKKTLKLSKYCWGLEKLEIDQELLALGKISLKSCYGIFQDGTFINEVLVREGYALVATYPPDVTKQAIFREAEQRAHEEKKGLWNESTCNGKQ